MLGLGREDVALQPVHQREVVDQAAKEHHWDVRVAVDKAWHDDGAARVDALGVRPVELECFRVTDGLDAPLVDHDGPIGDDRALGVEGDHRSRR